MTNQGRKTIDERRQSDRFSVNAEFAQLETGTLPFISNLSETGVFVHTRNRLPVGTLLELTFTVLLDDPVIISGPGKVIHHLDDPRGMGIEFSALSPEMILRIADVIRQHRTEVISENATPTPGIRGFRTRELTPEEFTYLSENPETPTEEAEPSDALTHPKHAKNLAKTPKTSAKPTELASDEPDYEDF